MAWNQAAPLHEQQRFARLLEDFRRPGYSLLDHVETAILKEIGLEGKAVAHLSCNNGRELLSVKNLGAGRCVGFDISDAFVDQARRLAQAAGLACEFVATDVYEIPATYDRSFDLVYITIGALLLAARPAGVLPGRGSAAAAGRLAVHVRDPPDHRYV
jgi:predicted RNA methylase